MHIIDITELPIVSQEELDDIIYSMYPKIKDIKGIVCNKRQFKEIRGYNGSSLRYMDGNAAPLGKQAKDPLMYDSYVNSHQIVPI